MFVIGFIFVIYFVHQVNHAMKFKEGLEEVRKNLNSFCCEKYWKLFLIQQEKRGKLNGFLMLRITDLVFASIFFVGTLSSSSEDNVGKNQKIKGNFIAATFFCIVISIFSIHLTRKIIKKCPKGEIEIEKYMD